MPLHVFKVLCAETTTFTLTNSCSFSKLWDCCRRIPGETQLEDEHHQTHNQNCANTTLIDACRLGDLHRVKYILSNDPASINSGGQYDKTPAMVAAMAGHRSLLELLVEKGANLSLLDDQDNNILHVACMEGNLEIVKYIHSQKIIDIDSRGGNGTTPLMSAAMFGKKDAFLFLMKNKANISKEDDDGKNILHAACQGGNVDIVKYVLTHNVLYVNSTDNKRITPLMLAAGYGNKDVFDILIERGSDTLAKDITNRNVLHWACQGGNVKIVKDILTQHIVDINSKDEKKMTPLLLAAYYGKIEVLELLVEKGANTVAVNEKGRNSLHLSCTRGHVDTVKYVLNQTRVGINSKDCEEMTAVMLAAYHEKHEAFDMLMKKGANLSIIDKKRENILHWACRGGNVNIVKSILMLNTLDINSKGYERTPVMLAASHGRNEVFDILLKNGANMSVTDKTGQNILHFACRGGNVKIVNYILIQNTWDINRKDDEEMTPLMLAASHGRNEVFDILVKEGADLSALDENGDSILHFACRGGNVKIVNYILTQNTLEINSKGDYEMTPVMRAAYYGKIEVFDILVKRGADLSVIDENSDNMAHLACRGGNIKIMNYILMKNFLGINSKDRDNMTAVMIAAYYGKREIFDVLVKKGAHLSGLDMDRDNILHLACRGGNVKIVEYILMQNLVDIDSKNSHGMTPVMLAANGDKRQVFDTLVKNGADLSGVKNDRDDVLPLACKGNDKENVKEFSMWA